MPDAKERIGINDLKDKNLWKYLLAEFLGNLLLNFFACGSCVALTGEGGILRIALAFGLVIFAGVQSFCHLSGGHLNPAVTTAFLIVGRISILKGLLYIIVQCLGSIVGSAILKAITPDDEEIQGTLGLTLIHPKLSAAQGLGVEIMLGFVLVLVVFAICDPNRDVGSIGPLAVGLTVALGHLLAVPLTGASMNPARTLGSAVVVNIWTDHWVYWLGPILGGVIAGLLYQFAFKAPPSDSDSEYSPVRADEKNYRPGSGHNYELKPLDNKNKKDLA